jgi:tetratricopeptide (TPR) repeat protein
MAPGVLKGRGAVKLRVLSVILMLSGLTGPVSRADEGGARAEAAAHYQRGLELANQQHYEEALDAFNAAYALSPHFAVLYNVGQAEMALGHPLEAIVALTRYLHDGGEQVPLSRRELVQAQIALLEAKLAELSITSERPGVTVRVDDLEVGQTPLFQPVRLAAGAHTVTASAPDGPTVTRQVTLAEGERQKLDLVFTPPPPPRPAAPPAPPLAAEPRPPTRNRTPVVTLPRAAVVAVATGLALCGAALGVYVWNGGRYEDWQNADATLRRLTPGTPEYRLTAMANNQLADSLASANDAILALSLAGGALVATGVVLYVVDRVHRRHAGEPTLAWTRAAGGARTPIAGWSVTW